MGRRWAVIWIMFALTKCQVVGYYLALLVVQFHGRQVVRPFVEHLAAGASTVQDVLQLRHDAFYRRPIHHVQQRPMTSTAMEWHVGIRNDLFVWALWPFKTGFAKGFAIRIAR